MGFDNECILNIQSLAGEYFCPVCRLLVYPNEAIQSQCTHLYCKPCLTYVVSTTRACPYDGYLVTEADSKPLVESNKALAETIDKIAVHCLFQRSGCTWQGPLSECTSHCAGCAFGNSPVVCNRCGTQIVHRQVQEHAQNCPGVQPQAQQTEVAQDATANEQNQAGAPAGAPASQSQAVQSSQTNAAAFLSGQDQTQASASVQPQAVAQAMPTPEQWYQQQQQQQQQQYQQYYQQYPGYDNYQQQYQHYDPYQQQVHQQYQQQQLQARPPHIPGQHPPQVYMPPQAQIQAQAMPPVQPQQVQLQPQPLAQSQPHALPQALVAVQPQMQGQVNSQQQPQLAAQPPPQGHQHPQPYSQVQTHPQQHPVQPHPQMQHTQPHPLPQPQPQPHLHPHSQPHAQPQPQLQPHMVPQSHTQPQVQAQPQSQSQPQSQAQPQTQPHPHPQPQPQHPSVHAVSGHQSYPQPPHQQLLPGPPQHPAYMHPQQQGVPLQPQHSVQMQNHFPHQQPSQMRPQSHGPVQQQQQPAMLPQQGQHPNIPPVQQPHAGQPLHQHPGMNPPQQQPPVLQQQGQQFHQQGSGQLHPSHPFPGQQTSGLVHNQAPQQGLSLQQQPTQSHLRPLGPPPSLQQHAYGNTQLQQSVPLGHGLQPQPLQNPAGRPMMPNHGVPQQPFPQSPGRPGGMGYAKPMQPGPNPPSQNQNYPSRTGIRPQSSLEQQVGYIQPSALSQSGGQNTLFPALPTAQSGANIPAAFARAISKPTSFENPSDSKHEKSANEIENDTASLKTSGNDGIGSVTTSSHDADSSELKVLKSESDSKSVVDEEKRADQDEGKNSQSDRAVTEILGSSQALGKDPESKSQEDAYEEPMIKQIVKEEASEKLSEPSPGSAKSHESREIRDAHQMEMTEGQDVNKPKGASDEGGAAQSLSAGERGNSKILPHHGYQDRNLLQAHFPRSGPSQQLMHYGAPPPQQRPPAPDQMLQSSMPPPQMHVPGQPPAQMRPQGYISHLHLLQHGQPSIPPEHFQQPMVKQPHGTFHAEVAPGGVLGPGSSASFGRGPAHLGPPQKGFEPQSMLPQGYHNQAIVPVPHAGGPRISPGESIRGPPFGGPPPGVFESHGSTMVRRPPYGVEGQMGQPRPPNPMEAEMFANKRPGYIEGGQPDSNMSGPAEHVPFGQASILSNKMKLNGVPGKGLTAGARDPSFPHGLQEGRFKALPDERYKRLPQEGFNQLPEERFNHFPMDPARHMIDRREFEEDLKQFPRPAHLDESGPKFESYFSSKPHGFGMDASSRPLDRAPAFVRDAGSKLDVGASAAASRLLPPYQSGGSSGHPLDSGERARSAGFHDDNIGRKVDPAGAHTEFLRPISEFGRPHVDAMGPPRSPGREYPSRFGSISAGLPLGTQSRLENMDDHESCVFGERSKPFNLPSDSVGGAFHDSKFPMLPSHMRRGDSDAPPGNLRIGEHFGSGALPVHLRSGDLVGSDNLPGHMRDREPFGPGSLSHLSGGGPLGPRNLPGHMRMGEHAGFGAFPSHLRISELSGPGNLPSHLRIGESIRGRLNEPGLGGPIPGFPNDGGFFSGDMESFDHSRKRKSGSMGWCRICKIDCETIEGLDLHSQTREHQKMAMDMVLNIKKDNAKKQKLASDDHTVEDASKSRKANFESRGNRH